MPCSDAPAMLAPNTFATLFVIDLVLALTSVLFTPTGPFVYHTGGYLHPHL